MVKIGFISKVTYLQAKFVSKTSYIHSNQWELRVWSRDSIWLLAWRRRLGVFTFCRFAVKRLVCEYGHVWRRCRKKTRINSKKEGTHAITVEKNGPKATLYASDGSRPKLSCCHNAYRKNCTINIQYATNAVIIL